MKKKGFALIELLVVISIFAILAILTTSALLSSLRGTRKGEALGRVRENLDYSFAVISRHLHSAQSLSCPSSTQISYEDVNGASATFSCINIDGTGGAVGYFASGSARLTSDEIDVISCTLTCSPGAVGISPSVTIVTAAEDLSLKGAEGAQVATQTKILLRVY